MKTLVKVLAVVACAAAVAMPAAAQEKKNTISLFGNYTKQKNQDGSGTAFLGYGVMVSPQLELGLNFLKSFGQGSSYGLGGSAQYYFSPAARPGTTVPYVKGDLFSMQMSGTSSTRYGASVGIEHAITESAGVFAEIGANSTSTSGTSTSGQAVNFGVKARF